MGDDLVAARRFSGLCQNSVKTLLGAENLQPARAIATLKAIQVQAKSLRARSISLAAGNAIEEYHSVLSPSQRAGALLTLNKLVCQYTQGLDEIAPQDKKLYEGPAPEEVATWAQVRDVFLPLQKFAKSGQEAAALSTLAALGPFSPGKPVADQNESFELLMPTITDESLRQARESEKSVSVSYATDDIFMHDGLARDVQAALIEICRGLVQGSVQAPNHRQNQGLSSAAHIAITAKKRGDNFDILISCEGPVPPKAILGGPKLAALRRRGTSVKISGHENLVKVSLTGLWMSKTEAPVQLYDQALGMRA